MEKIKAFFKKVWAWLKDVNWKRLAWLWVLPVAAVVYSAIYAANGWKETFIRLGNYIWIGVGVVLAYVITKAVLDCVGVPGRDIIKKAMESSSGAGMLFLGYAIFMAVLVLTFVGYGRV